METFETSTIVQGYRHTLEDRLEVLKTPFGLLLTLADGAGGSGGGAQAAQAVIEHVRGAVTHLSALDDPAMYVRLLHRIDSALLQDREAGESTAVVLSVSPHGVVGASVGDSGAWVIGSGGYVDLTGGQQRKPLLGTGRAIAEGFALPRLNGRLLVASDGLFKYAQAESICQVVLEYGLQEGAERLVSLVRLGTGELADDVAIALCERV